MFFVFSLSIHKRFLLFHFALAETRAPPLLERKWLIPMILYISILYNYAFLLYNRAFSSQYVVQHSSDVFVYLILYPP